MVQRPMANKDNELLQVNTPQRAFSMSKLISEPKGIQKSDEPSELTIDTQGDNVCVQLLLF